MRLRRRAAPRAARARAFAGRSADAAATLTVLIAADGRPTRAHQLATANRAVAAARAGEFGLSAGDGEVGLGGAPARRASRFCAKSAADVAAKQATPLAGASLAAADAKAAAAGGAVPRAAHAAVPPAASRPAASRSA